MKFHDRDWMPYRILRGDTVMGVDFNLKADYDEDVLVYTKLDKSLYNLLMGIVWGYSSYATYKANETDYIYHLERP